MPGTFHHERGMATIVKLGEDLGRLVSLQRKVLPENQAIGLGHPDSLKE
jgi:hypothetical protein